MSSIRKYSGQSPLIRRIVNDVPAEERARKIATKSGSDEASEALAAQGLEGNFNNGSSVSNVSALSTAEPSSSAPTLTPQRQSKKSQPKLRAKLGEVEGRSEKPKAIKRPEDTGKTSWRNLSKQQKFAKALEAAENAGAITININFSDRLQKTLLASPNPTRLVAGYINREIRKALGYRLPVLFTLEINEQSRLHAHGIVVIGNNERDLLQVDALVSAMAHAGGQVKASPIAKGKQIYFDRLYDAVGWNKYLLKAKAKTVRFLGHEKITFISNDLLRLAKG